jgi:hypothetical protein
MKKLVFIILVSLVGLSLQAQITHLTECSEIISDRAFYVSGEELQFSGLIYAPSSQEILSQVVYVELLDPLGNKINQQKYYLDDQQFSGRMIIPETIISGYYYLRAYTKYMRNGDPKNWGKLLIKVVNPFLFKIQKLADSLYMDNNECLEKTKVSLVNDRFKVDENITLKTDTLFHDKETLVQISIIPDASQNIIHRAKLSKSKTIDSIHFWPETRGLSLSGQIFINQKPSAYHLIYLNKIGEKAFQSVYSDSLGRFNFPLEEDFGIQELLIGAAQKDGKIEIKVDNDFAPEFHLEAVPTFSLNEKEKELALQLAQQYQINKWYFDSISEEVQKGKSLPLYQEVTKTIDLDFYIPLDSLSQYFTDIPSHVFVLKKDKKRYFKVSGESAEYSIYDPLIMVDWVPVDKPELILAMNPSGVKKIEVVKRLFYHINRQYAGIIHIHTRNQDLSDVKLPESSFYLNFQLPENRGTPSKKLQFPGTSTCFVLEEGIQKKQLQAPQLPGFYHILIQKILKNGEKEILDIPIEVIER